MKVDSDINLCSIEEIKKVVLSFKEMKDSTIVEKMDKLEQSVAIKKDLKHSTIVYVTCLVIFRRSLIHLWSRKSFSRNLNASRLFLGLVLILSAK